MFWKRFHTALTFLTPYGRAHMHSVEQISDSLGMYPFVGVLLGTILTLAGQLPLSPGIAAWLLVLLNILNTRGLHWDGWADLWDGWGSGARGERFWEIVKDSHIGAFGTIGLIAGLGLQACLYEQALARHAWALLAWSCVFGRYCCLVLARSNQDVTRPGLGRTALSGATGQALGLGLLPVVAFMPWLPVQGTLLTVLLSGVCLVTLSRFGRSQGAINGDFLGAAIIAGELCALMPIAIYG